MLGRITPLALALALGACAGTFDQPAAPVVPVPVEAQVRQELQTDTGVSAPVRAFYGERSYQPLWFDDGEFATARGPVVDELNRTAPEIGAVDQGSLANWRIASNGEAGTTELGLTEASLRYATALRAGRIQGSTETSGAAAVMLSLADQVNGSARAATGGGRLPDFVGQADGIARYEVLRSAGGWRPIPSGPSLEPGGLDSRLDAIRTRLAATGELVPGASSGQLYDPVLVTAVKRFQTRHGLAPDGVVGPATLAAMNVPVEARIAQLRRAQAQVAALEQRLAADYIVVNLPAYELRLVRDGQVDHQAKVIIGTTAHQTPEIHNTIKYLVFNPTWSVPYSIARDELIHEIRADPSVVSRRGFDVINSSGQKVNPGSVNWATATAGNYRFRQRPGSGNALGRVKFMFPNEHAVYLHDTPKRQLFERSKRALSHGCVRVHDPLTLATKLLEADGWDRARIDQTVASGRLTTVYLNRPLPVHLVYISAWTAPDGSVQFRPDIYGRDRSALQVASR